MQRKRSRRGTIERRTNRVCQQGYQLWLRYCVTAIRVGLEGRIGFRHQSRRIYIREGGPTDTHHMQSRCSVDRFLLNVVIRRRAGRIEKKTDRNEDQDSCKESKCHARAYLPGLFMLRCRISHESAISREKDLQKGMCRNLAASGLSSQENFPYQQ